MTLPARILPARILPALILTALLLPIGAGLWQTALAAMGHLPAIGARGPDLAPLRALAATPGIGRAVWLSLFTGAAATALSFALALASAMAITRRGHGGRLLAPLLAMPHAALAIGLAFVMAPSGWIARAIAPVVGWDRPPDIASIGDPFGLSLIAGLTVKEFPFLLLMMMGACAQIPLQRHLRAGRALGASEGRLWLALILPQIWPLMRLPVLVVLAYSMSVVDVALILGPSNPPTLAVLLTRDYADPDLSRLLAGSAGSLVQLALVGAAAGLLLLTQRVAASLGGAWVMRGAPAPGAGPVMAGLRWTATAATLAGFAAMAALAMWSVAWRWPFPDLLPQDPSFRIWARSLDGWTTPLWNTLLLAGGSTAIALIAAIAWLECETRTGRRAPWAEAAIFVPLLLPQIGFLYGVNTAALQAGLAPGLWLIVWGHVIFVFPYVMIALSDPWRAMDPQHLRVASALGAGPWRRLLAMRLPVMLRPILTAAAIGIAVSVAQYLPTLFLGAGRIPSLTTEAVTLAASSDRRVTGVVATMQAALPLLGFLIAFVIPAYLHRNRRGLRGA
ncbi:ABC transporter permease subunit [Paracoccus sp. 1_MG-2023]|uniref:ABC transporter permease n=1 Tax=unclassified Paracoccus (in: a-proteobacteria) TaxID=2688777 RepID=UPI001C095F13|nr:MULTISPECIES: ABC transporter permease subunit [unclassified Paracoccus (in: a-proteobacteria)]MBU2956088.1 ABC transporter permease subunit [Paracoccus sp. C2R09]MDO6669494.1 ABC transporter permease subunit [Paracoccus sp. 1_MG-2023]